jgi:anaerobic magnesium-protoporphyrin IX monomethyl ester cyclase
MFLMWGYEGEELPDIEATIQHVKRSNPDIFFTTVAYPIKGTTYYGRVADQLIQPKPWAESSDRDLMIKGRHSRRFYEHADHLLRDEVALARLSNNSSPQSAPAAELQQRIQVAREGLISSYSEVEA